ncbi:MAG: hypothetical protein JW966_10655 [Anaerolineae bacterium]|nr:hypothetical protein [Anaerolineae bacterium]
MVYCLQKLPDEPIAILTIGLPVERYISNLQSLQTDVARLVLVTEPPPLYCLLTWRGPSMAFSDVLLWLEEQRFDHPSSICDPRVQGVLVGTDPMLPIAVKRAKAHLYIDLPHLPSLAEALAYVRSEISRSAHS